MGPFMGAWAQRLKRTTLATRPRRRANGCPEIHQGLIPVMCVRAGKVSPGKFPNIGWPAKRLSFAHRVETPQDSNDICVDYRNALPECKAGNCVRSIFSDAGKCLEIFNVVWELSAKVGHHDFGKIVKSHRSVIVPHPSPGPDHLRGLCLRQFSERRIIPEKFTVFHHHAGDLCLLEHDLGNEYAVGVPLIAPGKFASVSPIPTQKSRNDSRFPILRMC